MSLLGKIFGAAGAAGGGAIAQPVEAVGNVIDQLFTSDDERLDRAEAMARLAQQPQLAQIEINKLEAQHRNVWVSGWRPFIGWVCGANLAYLVMVRDWLVLIFAVTWPEIAPPPAVGVDLTMELVIALLGLGAMRSVEKLGGRAK